MYIGGYRIRSVVGQKKMVATPTFQVANAAYRK